MTLLEYLESRDMSFTAAAAELGITSQHLSKVARGVMPGSGHLALRIEAWSQGHVPRQELRPDLYPAPKARTEMHTHQLD